VLLVDDDEARVAERSEEGRAGTHHHVRLAPANEVPLVEALACGRREWSTATSSPIAAAKAPDRLGRERDLRHEDERPSTGRQRMLDGIE